MEDSHLLDLNECLVAVDAYGWLHRGARTCARELALKIPTTGYLEYFMDQLELLLAYGVIPTLVFDGAALPSKSKENLHRAKLRKEQLEAALQFEADGDLVMAMQNFKSAVKVTPDMLLVITSELKRRRIDFLVAPHEADAQLAFLIKQGLVDAILAEDADMVPYGCNRVLFKLDRKGYCAEFKYARLSQFTILREALRLTKGKRKKDSSLDLSHFSHEQIIRMCIFAGCDYLKAVNGIKIGRAYELARDFQDFHEAIEFEKSRGLTFPSDYAESFHRALMTYKHQIVYDPDSQQTVHLSPILDTDNEQDLTFLGQLLPKSIAKGVAHGEINPHTLLMFGVAELKAENCPNKQAVAEEELQSLISRVIPIAKTWRMWCNNPSVASSSSTPLSVYTFSCSEELLRIYNFLPEPGKLVSGSLSCFREDSNPGWEDPDGGRWTLVIAKSEADKCWLRLLEALLGEKFDNANEICGAVLKVDSERDTIGLWTKNALNEELQMCIGKQLKMLLGFKLVMGYVLSEDAKKVSRGAKNKYTF